MKTRLLLTINNLDTAGMKYVLSALAHGIDKNDFTPVIIVNKRTGSALEKKIEKEFEVHELMLRNPGIISILPAVLKNARLIKKTVDLVHSFDYSSDWTEALTMKLAGIPYITEKTNLSFGSYRWKLKLGMANHIICLSTAQAKQLNMYSGKLTVIPTGIDISNFDKPASLKRQAFGLSDNDTVFISVAHLVAVKGYEELIEAIALLKNEFGSIKVICTGKGEPEYENHLKKLASEKGVPDRFLFTGNSDDVAGLLKMADIKILATQNRGRREAFGAAIVEAMAAGLPVLATRSGGPEDIVLDGVTGWLMNGDGVDAIVEGIRKSMQNRDAWQIMGEKGRQRAAELYNEPRMVEAYTAVYKKVMQQTKQK